MLSRCYLMSVGEFLDDAEGEGLLKAAMGKIDCARRERAEGMMPGLPRAACVGAGLLLQLAVRTAFGGGGCGEAGVEEGLPLQADGGAGVEEGLPLRACGKVGVVGGLFFGTDRSGTNAPTASEGGMDVPIAGEADGLTVYSALRVMELVGRPIELVMGYGEKGKPYLREYPLFFNLSHSGEYVVCAVSDREIGVDIQKCSDVDVGRIAERFFSKEECKALEGCGTVEERRRLFFRLWVRKEAYGKLLGEGITGVISESLLPDGRGSAATGELLWREWGWPEGYRIAMCQRAYQAQ